MASRRLWLALLVAALGLPAPLRPESPRPGEYEVKAAFLLNFARFAEWPAPGRPGAPLVLCVLGEDPFGPALDGLAALSVHGRPIAVRRAGIPADADSCQILYVSASEAARLPELLRRWGSRPVLTVSDLDGFAESGGIVQLIMAGNRVRFRVNVRAADRAGIRLSAKLLRLGEVVGGS